MTNPVYELTLHPSYYDKGFFNLGVAVDALIMPKDGPVVIELGGPHRSIEGHIDRGANLNGTPRVFGGPELRDWLQDNFQMGDRVDVHILDPARLRITTRSESKTESLEEIGFRKVSEWVLSDGRIKPHSLDWEECSSWIYAFVVDGRPRYFGITNTVLRSRLDHYSYQVGDKVRAFIVRELEQGRTVEIHGLQRVGVSRSDLESEESHLIREYGTDWNIRR